MDVPDLSNSTANAAPSNNITASDKKDGAVPGGMEVIDNPAIQSAAVSMQQTTCSIQPAFGV